MSNKTPAIDYNTADTATWRHVGHLLPDPAACDGDQLLDVLERNFKDQLVRSETEYSAGSGFYPQNGEPLYWCYQRPLPMEYLSQAEASADLREEVAGFAQQWDRAQAEHAPLLHANEVCVADYWLKVRCRFRELIAPLQTQDCGTCGGSGDDGHGGRCEVADCHGRQAQAA